VIARAFRECGILLALALIPAAISGAIQLKWQSSPEALLPGEVRLGTAQMWGDAVQWVDTRAAAKFTRGQIPGAVRLSAEQWDELIPSFLEVWDPEKTIVVYGEGGVDDDAHAVAGQLKRELQLDNVWVLKGGWVAWQQK
jgi:rhodanese-related sulfurtransferase